MHKAILLFGGNIGEIRSSFTKAENKLAENDCVIVKSSSVYSTQAWGIEEQPDFLNKAVEITTLHSPWELLALCLEIERSQGRIRSGKYAARTLDIDILFYDNWVFHSPTLSLPHPGIEKRKFVLDPLSELAGEKFRHPLSGLSVETLLERCADILRVEKLAG